MSRRDPFAPVIHDRLAAFLRGTVEDGTAAHAVPVSGAPGPMTRYADGRSRVNLGSNNYLGLTTDPRVLAGARRALEQYGSGVTGSRIFNGTTELVLQLESELARFFGFEAAVVTTTGYTANLALLSAVGRSDDLVLLDARSHASLHAGAAASRARVLRWHHNDLAALERRIDAADPAAGVVVVVDGVYSMEGESAPLRELVELCRRRGARLVVDEAHGLGVMGPRGRGAAEAAGVLDQVDAITLTMSKSLASCGGAVLTSAAMAEGLRGAAVPYLFAAGNVPAALGAALASLHVLEAEPERVASVTSRAQFLCSALEAAGVQVNPSSGAVLAVPVGPEALTVAAWSAVFDEGAYTNASIAPSVPVGAGVLRLSVMATHTDGQLERAADAVARGLRRTLALVPGQTRRTIDLTSSEGVTSGASVRRT